MENYDYILHPTESTISKWSVQASENKHMSNLLQEFLLNFLWADCRIYHELSRQFYEDIEASRSIQLESLSLFLDAQDNEAKRNAGSVKPALGGKGITIFSSEEKDMVRLKVIDDEELNGMDDYYLSCSLCRGNCSRNPIVSDRRQIEFELSNEQNHPQFSSSSKIATQSYFKHPREDSFSFEKREFVIALSDEHTIHHLPIDAEYLLKQTYFDTITLIFEFIHYHNESVYYKTINDVEYLEIILQKALSTSISSTPYSLLMAQVFLVYFRQYQHEVTYETLLLIMSPLYPPDRHHPTEQLATILQHAARVLADLISKLSDHSLQSLQINQYNNSGIQQFFEHESAIEFQDGGPGIDLDVIDERLLHNQARLYPNDVELSNGQGLFLDPISSISHPTYLPPMDHSVQIIIPTDPFISLPLTFPEPTMFLHPSMGLFQNYELHNVITKSSDASNYDSHQQSLLDRVSLGTNEVVSMSDSELHLLKQTTQDYQRNTRKRRLSLPPEMLPKKRKSLSLSEATQNPILSPLADRHQNKQVIPVSKQVGTVKSQGKTKRKAVPNQEDKENIVNDLIETINKSDDISEQEHNSQREDNHLSVQQQEKENITESKLTVQTDEFQLRKSPRKSKNQQEKIATDFSTLEILANQAAKIAESDLNLQSKGKKSRKNSFIEPTNEGDVEEIENQLISPVRRRQKIKRKRFSICLEESVDTPQSKTTSPASKDDLNQLKSDLTDSTEDKFSPQSTPNKVASKQSSSSKKSHNRIAFQATDHLSLKGVVPLHTGRYRVQLNAFRQEKSKFSRNSACLVEGLWIFEICLLISDKPRQLSLQMNAGNYYNLSQVSTIFGFYQNPIEYFAQLGYNIILFEQNKRYFDEELLNSAIENLEHLVLNNVELGDMSLLESQIEEKYGTDFNKEACKAFWKKLFQMFRSKMSMDAANIRFHELFTLESMTYQANPHLFLTKEVEDEVGEDEN